MKITWTQSVIDGRWYNDRMKPLTIQYMGNNIYDVVHGVTLIDSCNNERAAKVRANNYIRTIKCQKELCQAELKRLL